MTGGLTMSMVYIQKPEKVFQYFEKICSIPHGSRNVEKISNYLVSFAKEHGLKYRQDDHIVFFILTIFKTMLLNIVRMKNTM